MEDALPKKIFLSKDVKLEDICEGNILVFSNKESILLNRREIVRKIDPKKMILHTKRIIKNDNPVLVSNFPFKEEYVSYDGMAVLNAFSEGKVYGYSYKNGIRTKN